MAIAPQRAAIGIRRHFTTEGVHPYDQVRWERRDARITNFRDGTVAFEQLGVEVPEFWSLNATNILAQKYFRGTLGTPEREWSLKQVADRVVDTITAWGVKDGYFVDLAEAEIFRDELKHLIIHQKAAFNSPVWFNIGVHGVPQQGSACQPYDALVSTPEGMVPIGRLVEERAVGSKVLDAHGVTRIVAVKHNGQRDVLRIHTESGHQLDVTPDHLVWRASDDHGGIDQGAFAQAGELRLGDLLVVCTDGRAGTTDVQAIDALGTMDVYDIQTESGEYLSADLRVHNCFILSVDDSMDSILNWYVEEGIIFKGGSGAGVNLSRIRSSQELLKGGGTASGPVSFMRGADASAGTIKSGGKCFREGTLVSTPAGWRPIEQLRIGDVVLTHEGPRPVADFVPNGEKQCYRVVTREGYEVEVTAGHKFAYWNEAEGGFEVKPIEEFSAGDSLYVLLEPSEEGVTIPLLPPEIADPAKARTTLEMQLPTVLDDRLAYVLGLAYGDGHLRTEDPYWLRIAFCKDQAGRVSVERFSSYCEELFGERPIVLGDESGHQKVGITRKRLTEFLRVNGIAKGKAAALGFPSLLLQATPEVRAAFLAGVIDADRSYQARGGWSVSSIDRDFLRQLQLLALSLGIPSKLKVGRPAEGTWQTLYRLDVVGRTFVERLVARLRPYSAKIEVNYVPSPGADKGWGYRPSLLKPLAARVQRRGGYDIVERSVGTNETSGYGAVAVLTRHSDAPVAEYARELTTTVQVTLESVAPTDVAKTYDIEVEGTHLLSANGIYASNTRRAAKMVILDADHPDIEDFIWCKALEERKARVLRDAGFDMDLDGADSHSIQYQNANNSVRVTDEFMQAVLADADWELTARTDGAVIRRVKARDLFRQIAHAAWECADPGMQFDTTINKWHTAPNTGRINGSNPCSEYMHLDNSACNLASLNLLKFLNADGSFDVEGFKAAVEVIFTGQEIIVGNADYPTEKIAENSRKFRELGIGYANLGALLMANGLPYDSDAGRAWAGAVTALMTGHAYATSAKTASRMGPFAGFHENAEPMVNVLRMHQSEASKIDEELVPPELLSAAQQAWDEAVELAEQYGVRNSQASVLAPTGCLVGGTLVSTGRGLVRLGSLGDPDGERWQDLDEVVATDEGPRQATKFFVNGIEPVVTVETARGHRVQGTTTHRVKVVDAKTGEWVWRRFADVREGDVVPLSLGSRVGVPQHVQLPPLADAYWTGEHHLRVPEEMTPELAELVGYFMGDGSLHSRGLRLCVTDTDFDVVERLSYLLKECFGASAKVAERRGYAEVRLDSVRVALWWEACGFSKRAPHPDRTGKGYVAHVPDAVLHSNDPEVYAAFVRGLFEADGDTSVGYPTLKNASVDMVRDVQTILLAMRIPTTLSVRDRTRAASCEKAPLATLRLVDLSYNAEWSSSIGFMGGRKNAGVQATDPAVARTAPRDCIPLTRSLIDRLAPANDGTRRVLLMEHARGRVSRRLATELFERTGDPELGHLLSFVYDAVTSAELTGEELTYDLSVPENVTYVANGFVSHNTIGLLMDCDTTGVEPDLGLVKTKKLVGGGTMSIVNQTVPRALRQLGYAQDQIDQIVAYIDEHKTIVGAPYLTAEHLPVFACSMGDNTIHYSGHVRMMGAVQPFISGAISKCVVGDTLVPTEDGLVRIGSLYEGEEPDSFRSERVLVASLEGAQKTDAFYYGGERAVRKVRLRSGHKVTGTPNHRVLVADGSGLTWKRLDEVEIGDEVAVRYGADMWAATAPLVPFPHRDISGSQHQVRVPRELTEDLAFLLGAYASEGCRVSSGWSIRITNSVPEVLERIATAAQRVFDGSVNVRVRRPQHRCAFVEINSKTIVELFELLGCGHRASEKQIPDIVLRAPKSHVLAFLQGLALDAYSSDGGMAKWAICLDSPALLDDLQSVLTNLGIIHSRISKLNRENGKTYDEVYASGPYAQEMVRLVPFLEPDKVAAAEKLLCRSFGQSTADVVPGLSGPDLYRAIPEGRRTGFRFLGDDRTHHTSRRTLERVGAIEGVVLPAWLRTVLDEELHFSPVVEAGDAGRRVVYDLSVPATHAFVGNGIVNHNTVNMPEDVTVEDVEQLHIDAWRLGIKAVAIYRDNCKVAQPLSTTKKEGTVVEGGDTALPGSDAEAKDREIAARIAELEQALEHERARKAEPVVVGAVRERLPRRRRSNTFAFRVADCEGYVTVGEYEDGRPGEVFIKVSKQGSTLAGIMDAFSISISLGLQHGVPLATYVRKYSNMKFEPAGITDDAELRIASSLVDYIFRRLALDYLTYEERLDLGVLSTSERIQPTLPGVEESATPSVGLVGEEPTLETGMTAISAEAPPTPRTAASAAAASLARAEQRDAPFCYNCGNVMQRAGSCYVCPSCGSTSGCS